MIFIRKCNLVKVDGYFYVNKHLEELMFEELRNACRSGGIGGFLPAMKQIGNVAALPGIVGVRLLSFDHCLLSKKKFMKALGIF